jgi:[acyl-carrier-protein] S-malonyltransferase
MKLAFVFPGQGSQSLGMLSEMADQFSVVKDTFDEANQVLGYDLWEVVQNGPEESLNKTQVTQPAMLAGGVACYRAWIEQGGNQPAFMAGHSLGEYTAYVCADSLNFADAIKLVEDRGRYMQEAVAPGEGAMAAILGLDDEKVQLCCEEGAQGEVVAAVNFNSPGQVVVAGQSEAVQRVVKACQESGAKRAVMLAVGVPSHCQLMDPAAHQLAERLQMISINAPSIPVINNVDVDIRSDAAEIRDTLTRQLCNPVRWVEVIQAMQGKGVTDVVECGPGKVLVGLNKRIDKSIKSHTIFNPESLRNTLLAFA